MSLYQNVIRDFAQAQGCPDLVDRSWYLLTGKAGPNAMIKVIIPQINAQSGYVINITRNAETPVVDREVQILKRLAETLPPELRMTVPTVLHRGTCCGLPYFVLPHYWSDRCNLLRRRWFRPRRRNWVMRWTLELAVATRTGPLTPEFLESEFGDALIQLEADETIEGTTKKTVREHYELIKARSAEIPGICCHGDLWEGNLLWQKGFANAMVIDWGAARWPGLPAVDLARFVLDNGFSMEEAGTTLDHYCRKLGVNPALLPALLDLYYLFVRAELYHAFQYQPQFRFDPFAAGLPSTRLMELNLQ